MCACCVMCRNSKCAVALSNLSSRRSIVFAPFASNVDHVESFHGRRQQCVSSNRERRLCGRARYRGEDENQPCRNRCPKPSHGSTDGRCSSIMHPRSVHRSHVLELYPKESISGVPYPVLADETGAVGADTAVFQSSINQSFVHGVFLHSAFQVIA
ncbi:hypothetical protein BO82DRAFT_24766 [Aspergillus uvarum CBS 121591]|uniref:Uncharacterized protein n=1 Tax=Aspergillus uvarum CBS 121591 TaxID=1448315 RepID=A0A319CG27_9EURO|nr:hypothetical protein BO82DRAFT_24766 [Aspergillus uvarum CBS 121591]PYH84204.1 hypothetical protein BO82DRAFT_24766 [Aspergillus uvarum CBS 121591]